MISCSVFNKVSNLTMLRRNLMYYLLFSICSTLEKAAQEKIYLFHEKTEATDLKYFIYIINILTSFKNLVDIWSDLCSKWKFTRLQLDSLHFECSLHIDALYNQNQIPVALSEGNHIMVKPVRFLFICLYLRSLGQNQVWQKQTQLH